MTDLSFEISFPRFEDRARKATFYRGLNIIYGESGVGKTTLCRLLAGYPERNSRSNFEVELDNWVENCMMVLQDPDDQIVAPTLFRELAFNLENRGLSTHRIQQEIENCRKRFGIDWDLDRHPSTLSGGEKQMLNLVTALSAEPELLAIDDGFSFLSQANKDKMVDLIEDYCNKRDAVVVWMTSEPADLAYSERRWELRLDSFNEREIEPTGEEIGNTLIPGRAFLQLRSFSFGYEGQMPLFDDESVTIGPFRSLSILGENGSGKSTLGHLISGLLRPTGGTISLEVAPRKKVKLGYLLQFPERAAGSASFQELVGRMIESKLFSAQNLILLQSILKDFQISWNLVMEKPIYSLRLSVARIILLMLVCYANYDLLILDEPTFSLGAEQQKKLKRFICRFLRRKHLIVISHNDCFTKNICDAAVELSNRQVNQLSLDKKKYV